MITSRINPKLKELRRLKRPRGDMALLEGPHLIQEALSSGLELDFVLATPEFLNRESSLSLLAGLPFPPQEVDERVLDEIADADSPRGIVAAARVPRGTVSVLPSGPGIIVYLDGIQDPGNLGALARSVEASGCSGLALSPGCAHPNHPRALRAAAGSLLRLALAVDVVPEELDGHLAAEERPWVALEATTGSSLYEADLPEDLILALGAEGPGLSARVRERADLFVHIPMARNVESLNVTVAGAVVLFELQRRKNEAAPRNR